MKSLSKSRTRNRVRLGTKLYIAFNLKCFSMLVFETGAHSRTYGGQVFKVSRVIKQPQFSMQHLRHDVALLKLSKAVKLSGKINTVCLPKHGSRVSQGTTCYVTGNNLKWVDFKVVLIKQNSQRSLLMTAVINNRNTLKTAI